MEYYIVILICVVAWGFIGVLYTFYLIHDRFDNRHYNTVLFKAIYGPILLLAYVVYIFDYISDKISRLR